MRLLISTVSVSILALSGLVYAQGTSASYPCESPEVKTALETDLSQDELVKLPTVERLQRLQRAVDSLLAKYPRDYLVYQEQTTLAYLQPDAAAAVKALREHWEKEAEAHPDDPIVLTEAAALIADQDPAKAINLLNTAKTKVPGMPWSSFELANMYSAGRRYSDQARMKETLERFYTLCPAWVSDTYFGNQMEAAKLRSDPPLLAKTATALRADLATESAPTRLKDYQVLWQREFLVRAPAEQAQERAQIQADLKRLEKMVPNGDGDWRLFLIAGHKLAGASNQELQQMQQQAAHDFPHQAPAEQWEAEQWQQAHRQPEGQKDAAAWKAYYAAEVEHMKMLIREYPDDAFAQRTEFFATVRDDEYVSEEDGLAAVNRLLDAMHTYGGYGILSFGSMDVPRFLLQHGWEPERALELLKDTQTHKGGGHTQEQPWAASLDDETPKRFRRQAMSEDLEEIGLFLKAAQLAGKPEEALRLREVVEGPPPANEQDLTRYW